MQSMHSVLARNIFPDLFSLIDFAAMQFRQYLCGCEGMRAQRRSATSNALTLPGVRRLRWARRVVAQSRTLMRVFFA